MPDARHVLLREHCRVRYIHGFRLYSQAAVFEADLRAAGLDFVLLRQNIYHILVDLSCLAVAGAISPRATQADPTATIQDPHLADAAPPTTLTGLQVTFSACTTLTISQRCMQS